MQVVRSDDHRLHFPVGEIAGGELVRPFECPERWDYIVNALNDHGLTDFQEPTTVDPQLLNKVHDASYLDFLQHGWSRWVESGATGEMIPTCFPGRRMRQIPPVDIDGQLGYYAFAAETSITAGTWQAAHAGASIASTAQGTAQTSGAAFALCRPPGHHAAKDYFGGYCFINNAAVATQGFLDSGSSKVAIIDVDFHHGNGTQDIFYDRADVLFGSIHGHPSHEFPHFLGFADETGEGEGEGFNINHPLMPGTQFDRWLSSLDDLCQRTVDFGAEALVVSLGVDAFEEDPISSFKLGSDDFVTIGKRLASLQLPTVYCMEGGYAVEAIGRNTVNVLIGDAR